MDFAVDVIVIQQPLGAAGSQLTQNGPRGSGNEREHATAAELLPVERRRAGLVRQASIRQVIFQRIAHDILETQPPQRCLGLRLPEQTLRNVDGGAHKRHLSIVDVFVLARAPVPIRRHRSVSGAVEFAGYDVVVPEYNGDDWPKRVQESFETYMENGGGMVYAHAVDHTFTDRTMCSPRRRPAAGARQKAWVSSGGATRGSSHNETAPGGVVEPTTLPGAIDVRRR